jgi:C-terminal processing protease CtpA/Prc
MRGNILANVRTNDIPEHGLGPRLRSGLQHSLVCLAFVLSACGGGGDGSSNRVTATAPAPAPTPEPEPEPAFPPPHSQCSLTEAREDVLDIFEDIYYFNEIPSQVAKYQSIRANLTSYPSVDALLDDLRYQPGLFDRGFSYYATIEAVEQFFSAGEFFGFGFSLGIDADLSWRLIDVFGGSPADLSGLVRSDTITAVNGTPTSSLDPNAESSFGPAEEGVQRTLTIRSLGGSVRDVTLTKVAVDLDPVPQDRVQVFDVGGRRVGYVFFRTFIEDADEQLRSAFSTLGAQGIDDLVLDLRYNGGGLVSTAEIFGSLIAGNARAGLVFFSYEYNDWVETNFGGPDDLRQFHTEAAAIDGLQNVYYLTGSGSASASELTISGLAPYYQSNSHVIGATTFGKPVGQWGIDYCNDSMVLFVVTFRTVNADGEADYYGGIPPECTAPDDWDRLLGDPAEARLKAALDYAETSGAICNPPVLRAAASLSGAPVIHLMPDVEGNTLASRLLGAH